MNFVVIGTGRMGKEHIRAGIKAGLTLSGLCDQSRTRLNAVAMEFGVSDKLCFSNYMQLLGDVDAPLVIIATTANMHAELVIAAAKAGAKYILCEKPMATSIADCHSMIKVCEDNEVQLAINHQMRFMDQYQNIKKELEGGHLGNLGSMNVVAGCFGLAMNGSHYFEAFRYLTGSRIEAVSSHFSPDKLANPRGVDFQDVAGELLCIAKSGQRLLISAGGDQGHGMTVTYATGYGHIFCDELQGIYYVTARKPEFRNEPSSRYGLPCNRLKRNFPLADNFNSTYSVLESLIAGTDYPNGCDGLRVIETLVAAYKSAEKQGEFVMTDDLSSHENVRYPWA